MTSRSLYEATARLDRVFEMSDRIDDDEAKSHLARYLCVLTSGYLEEVIKILIQDYVAAQSSPTVANHVSSRTSNLTNLNSEKIGQLLNSFSSSWRDKFIDCLSEEEKDAIDSVVANRHQIAHGRNVGVSYVRIKDWYKDIKRVVDKIRVIMR